MKYLLKNFFLLTIVTAISSLLFAQKKKAAVSPGHTAAITNACFNKSGDLILTASADKTARLWNAGTGELIQTFGGHKGEVTSVEFSRDEQKVLTASGDGSAIVWDVK